MSINNTTKFVTAFSQVPTQEAQEDQEEIPLRECHPHSPSQKPILPSQWKSLSWPWDIASWILSLFCFLAIVIVLLYFHNRELPNWPWSITINTMISILTSLGTLLLAVPIASALGQTKWLRLDQRRSLYDFVLVDDATRSPWGGFVLLIRRRGG